ncbi:MAG: hypothetical protein FWC67_01420 [Defluviitaleaceae bacterium]|nr:hypothetical protein [Defluviitaleaceae bacterium]
MELTMQINEMVEQLEEDEKLLLIEIIKRFLPDDDYLTQEDFDDIAEAEQELREGRTVSYNDIKWHKDYA